MAITLRNITIEASGSCLSIPHWRLDTDQQCFIYSTYRSVGSLLAAAIDGKMALKDGTIEGLPERVALVSHAEQQGLLEQEIANDDSDYLDKTDPGRCVRTLVAEHCGSERECEQLLQQLDLLGLEDRGFRQLSSGEIQRLMLARALAAKPRLLILDDPFAGLDQSHQLDLARLLDRLAEKIQLILISARDEHLPNCLTHVAMFERKQDNVLKLCDPVTIAHYKTHPVRQQLIALSMQQSGEILAQIRLQGSPSYLGNVRVRLRNGRVAYHNKVIFEGVNWQVDAGQHWQIRGPNGCGKSTLLALILGDHPQCYANDLQVLGYQRGSGETVWDIKRQIGVVSSALHLQYRVSCSALNVLLSGFFDTIGLYDKPSKRQIALAKEWLALLEMAELADTGFRQLNFGQQRLLLIGRALIKQPALLILDEPYHGLDLLSHRLIYKVLDMITREYLAQVLYVSHYEEDSLPAIQHFVDFVPQQGGVFEVRIESKALKG
ncbi:ATP-binding cassette domain-containing protein [Ferrimonas pelagia]|uniref:ATP-binding cassette domain-containing protein n=1 Tax=Ferrimonas pelagia TaxID=1177826 RepID=A0ABP9EWX6_9GAMM